MNGVTWIPDIAQAAGTRFAHLVHADFASGAA